MKQNLNFEALKKNLIDVVNEFQIKLGYEEVPISLYYSTAALNRRLDSQLNEDEMFTAMQEFVSFAKDTLGNISVSHDNGRFCVCIPKDGVKYVHDTIKNTGFLKEFIETISRGISNTDDILNVFRRYSDHVHFEKMNSDEFDYLIYFEDGTPDDFRYCIKFEGKFAIYHRFTPKDYEALGF